MNNHRRFAALALGTAVLLSACANVDTYRAAPIEVAAQFGLGDSEQNAPTQLLLKPVADPADQPELDPWSQQFGDERLDRLVTLMLRTNTDLAAAGLRVRRARLVAGLADSDALPHFDGSVSSGVSRALEHDTAIERSSSARVSVSYELDLWGKLRAQRDVAHWQAQASAEDLRSTSLMLIADTCSLYWTLGFLNQRIAHGTESLARVERTLRLVQAQFAAGAISRIEVREAEQNLQSQRAAQSQLQQSRVETRNAITVLLDGHPWPEVDEPQDLDTDQSNAPAAGLPAELLSRRPDLRAAELRLRASLGGVTVARTSLYPALTLTGAVGSSSESLLDVLKNPVATLGAGLSLPFLQWREMRLNTAIADTDYAIAANDFRKLLYTAFTEVDNALSARIELARQVDALQQSLAAAAQIENLYEVRYRAGATPLRTWLDAQETRRGADLALTEARLRLLQNDATLYLALGGR